MQSAKFIRERTQKACVTEHQAGEEGEVAKLRGDAAFKWHMVEVKTSDTLPLRAARDPNPRAERCSGSPVAGKDAEGILELCFEGEQCFQVCAIGWCGERSGTWRE